MNYTTKRFLRENLLGLSLTCIGVLLLAFSLILHFDHPSTVFVLANGNGLDGPDIESLQKIDGAYERIAQAVLPSVVAIRSTQVTKVQSPLWGMDPFLRQFFGNMLPQVPQEQRQRALGSGTIVSPDGYILTNNHVIAHATQITVVLHDNRQFKGKVVGADPQTDIAVVKIDAHNLPTAVLGDSSTLHVGDMVMAFGNPFEQYFTMTRGIVSALGRASDQAEPMAANFIQTDAAINPGNSGGALVNIHGQVIGVPTWIISGGNGGEQGGFLGIGFAIPIDEAKHVMTDLIKTGKVTRGYLGATLGVVTADLAKQFNAPDTAGALIEDVTPGGPAAKAGIKNGDIIRRINGESIEGQGQLQADVENADPGTTITLGILRNGQRLNVKVTLGTRPANLPQYAGQGGPEGQGGQGQAPSGGPLAGVTVQNLTSGILQQLGLPSSVHGVVVTNVDSNSPAVRYLTQGDVIESINRHPVDNAQQFDQLASQAKGQTLLRVIRQGAPYYIVVSPNGDDDQ